MKEYGVGGKALTEAAKAYLEAHSEEKFCLNQLADALYVNGSYLLRTFRRQTGMTLLEYHHRVRLERAKEMLAGTDRSVSEIGEAAGYVSSSHFSHVFLKMEGCTPSQYRSRHRTEAGGESS